MRFHKAWMAVALLVVATACSKRAATPPAAAALPKDTLPKELVVGTSGGSPPYVTRRAGTISGLELDLAAEVGKVLGVPVRIVDVPWDKLFDELGSRKVDVVMAGVTVTPERQTRFAFAEPYLRTGIVALVQAKDRERLGSRDAACKSNVKVGVVGQTTGERFVREHCPKAKVRVFATADDAVLELTHGRLDAVVGDGPVLAYLMSQQAVALELVPTGNVDEQLAWMVRQNDTALQQALNGALETMRRDGTLDRVLEKWIPQVERVRNP
ncbi:MAG: amino acid ABC transporter substrate-binding protein [bacterium]|nr:amino acid ABC transporter substrate-binding protein [bacterium]